MTEVLFIEQAPTEGAEHRLGDGATIGRAGCDVALDDPDVSRRHAVLRLEGSGVAVEDLGSTNGTFVNDARIGALTELRDGDRLRFGKVVWELQVPVQATRMVATARPGPAAPSAHQRATADPRRNESRGDVPKPDFAPSQVARVVASDGATPDFPAGRRFKRSAARRVEATVVSYGVVIATAVAVAAYFAQR